MPSFEVEFYLWLHRVFTSSLMNMIYFLVILLGILGNMTNVIIFTNKKMGNSLTFTLISHLSFIDMVILSLSAIETFYDSYFNINIRISSLFFCKVDTFLAYFLVHIRNTVFMAIALNSKQQLL